MLRLSEIPENLSTEQFWALVGDMEHEGLDFKRGVPDLTTVIPAMAMTDGGLIILGVQDDRAIVGCALSQNTLDRVMRQAHLCGVQVSLKEVTVSGVALTFVAVPEIRGRIVTTPDGRLVRRVGSDSQPLIGDVLGRFVREREGRSAEDEALPVFEPRDFDRSLINDALKREGKRTLDKTESLARGLIELDVALPSAPPADVQILRAAALVFAHEPSRFVEGATVQIVRRSGVGPGPGPSMARKELEGPIPHLLDQSLDFIAHHTSQLEAVVGARRIVLAEYPQEVLREALLNALAHRDYGLAGATVDVTIWDDRIEIQSPGPLPGHITLDNIRDEHYSRNRRVMRALKLLGLVEEYGEGVDRMIREMEARSMEPPGFSATSASVTVTLRNRFLVAVEDQVWLSLLGHFELSPSERRLLVLARHEGGVTPRRLRGLMPEMDINGLLRGAVAKGLVVRVGQAGGARYVLTDEVVMRAGASGLEAQSRKRQMLLDEIRLRGSVSTSEGADLLDEDMSVVRHLLNDLVRGGLAEAKGRTRARRYYLK